MNADHYLLLDEPFSGLDINMVKEVSNTLKEIACMDEENTIIIVSHDITATAAIADTLWVMGRDRNPDGSIVPGAYIKYTLDLMERGLAWDESSHANPAFSQLLHEVLTLFPTL
jgi:polar amino acid transport system ATP-binding protein/sulfate transport system ATP-binding protein